MPTVTGLASSFINFSRPGASGGGATTTLSNGRIGWAGHNLLTHSEAFDAWNKTGATVSANSTIAPNSTTTADTINASAGTSNHCVYSANVSAIANVNNTIGVYLKKGTHNYITLIALGSLTSWVAITVDFSGATPVISKTGAGAAGTYVSSGVDAPVSGFYRVWFTGSHTTVPVQVEVALASSATPTYGSFGEESWNAAGTETVIAWGAHLYRSDMQMQQNPAMPAGMGSYYPTTPRNLLGYSEAFGSWTGNSASVLADSAVAPNGLQTADKIYPTSSAGRVTQTAGTYAVKTISVYAKAAEMTVLNIRVPDNAGAAMIYANLATGVTTIGNAAYDPWCTHGAVSVGNGWWRVWLAINANGPSASTVSFAPCDAVGSTTSTPSGTNGIYLWGAQLSDSASLDTYVPQYGAAVTSAAYYAPRLDFDPVTLAARGLLVEEQRVNLLLNSASTTAWSGTAMNSTADQYTAPDGTLTGDKLTTASDTGNRNIYQTVSSLSGTYTFAIYVRADTANDINLRLLGTTDTNVRFSLTSETVVSGTGGIITPVGGGWYRCSVTGPTTNGYLVYLYINDAATGVSVGIWGAQLEAGSFATSYIPTGASTATRTADVASVSTQAFPYSASEGTVVANGTFFGLNKGASDGLVALTNGTAAENIALFRTGSGNNIQFAMRDNSSDQAAYTVAMGSQPIKAAFAYAENNSNAALNGTVQTTDTTCTLPTVNEMLIGSIYAKGDYPTNGWIRQITYIPRRLSNAELASRTAA